MRDSLKKSEFWSAMILLVLHMAVFPIALSLLMAAKPDLLSASQMNFIYYALSLLLVALFLGKFLRRSFDGLVDAPGRCLTSFALGWVAYIALGMIATYALKELNINTDNLNEQTISTMLGSDRGIIIASKQPRRGLRRVDRDLLPLPRLAVRRAAVGRKLSAACDTVYPGGDSPVQDLRALRLDLDEHILPHVGQRDRRVLRRQRRCRTSTLI